MKQFLNNLWYIIERMYSGKNYWLIAHILFGVFGSWILVCFGLPSLITLIIISTTALVYELLQWLSNEYHGTDGFLDSIGDLTGTIIFALPVIYQWRFF